MAEYIEREALLTQIKEAQASLESGIDAIWEMNRKYFKGLAWAHRLILDASAVDVAPVVHGRWEESMVSAPDYFGLVFGWKCSECGYNFEDRSKHRKKPIFMKFCPNCGARMDGGAVDGV